MFEQELEMERKESVVPLLLIIAFIVGVVGFAGYYVVQMRKVLPLDEATKVVARAIEDQTQPTVSFYTGKVNGAVEDNAQDPQYKLLQKAGLITLGKPTGTYGQTIPVELTAKGNELLKQIPGATERKMSDGAVKHVVPLAARKLVSVTDLKMVNPNRATVNVAWAWQTNALGDMFDAAGPEVQSFNTWERSVLIEKNGAAFYHGEPTKVVMALSKTDAGWQIATE
jgi:hypothetical protein